MDPICHTLLGGALGESGLKTRSGLATATLLIGANLPDIDILAAFGGNALGFRRGWTHGVLAWVVFPLLLTGLMLGWDRLGRRVGRAGPPVVPRQLLLLAGLAVLTHPFLDFLNTYGIRLLMPFNGRWFYGDAVFIVDPWLWLVLAGGILGTRLRSIRGRDRERRPARVGLALAGCYIAAMIGLTSVGRRVVLQDLELDQPLSRRAMMVAPVPLNPLPREVVLADQDRYWLGEIRWFPRPRLHLSGDYVFKAFDDPRLDLVEPTKASRQLLAWARFPYYAVEGVEGQTEGQRRLRLDDARYGQGRPSWAAVTWRLNY